ncbi:MAG: Rieske 2Fe-2S domain-containing protein [Myxococcales bacterium]|nr:Rieske 2Fe-2S domain-containing protein [Myxococcales bacterium]
MSRELARIPVAVLSGGALVRLRHPPFDVVVGMIDGVAFALEDACPHSGASLAEGCVRGTHLVCPMHGWEIDVHTGAVLTAVGAGLASPVHEADVVGDEVIVRVSSAT